MDLRAYFKHTNQMENEEKKDDIRLTEKIFTYYDMIRFSKFLDEWHYREKIGITNIVTKKNATRSEILDIWIEKHYR